MNQNDQKYFVVVINCTSRKQVQSQKRRKCVDADELIDQYSKIYNKDISVLYLQYGKTYGEKFRPLTRISCNLYSIIYRFNGGDFFQTDLQRLPNIFDLPYFILKELKPGNMLVINKHKCQKHNFYQNCSLNHQVFEIAFIDSRGHMTLENL